MCLLQQVYLFFQQINHPFLFINNPVQQYYLYVSGTGLFITTIWFGRRKNLTYQTMSFLTPKGREEMEEFIFERLTYLRVFLDLGLIAQDLEDEFNLSYKWKKFIKN